MCVLHKHPAMSCTYDTDCVGASVHERLGHQLADQLLPAHTPGQVRRCCLATHTLHSFDIILVSPTCMLACPQ